MKTSYLFLADGFEEIEALATVDVLRRAGMAVRTMSINPNNRLVTGAHGVTVTADLALDAALLPDALWLILPGGMPGASNLAACQPLTEALLAHHEQEGNIAAICASPSIVLAPLGILDGRDAVCYPSMENRDCSARWADAMVVQDGHVITGRGPAAASHFALAIVAATLGDDAAHEVAAGMLL
ncbi:MAG: DJ-1/PfpI family protein [Muribaculaceae bacterium]|nr:DJ-1/PfpI family protein [Muribaculaceae bacterium]